LYKNSECVLNTTWSLQSRSKKRTQGSKYTQTRCTQDALLSAELNHQVMQLVLDVNCSRSCQRASEGHYTWDWIWKYSRKSSFRLPTIESKPATQWDVTAYIHVSIFRNFSACSFFKLVSEERSQQN